MAMTKEQHDAVGAAIADITQALMSIPLEMLEEYVRTAEKDVVCFAAMHAEGPQAAVTRASIQAAHMMMQCRSHLERLRAGLLHDWKGKV